MVYLYKTKGGVCSRSLKFAVEDGVVTQLDFDGGCSGNAQGIASLAVGMPVEEVIIRLKNIKCGHKVSSCPDQLARALEEYLKNMTKESLHSNRS